MEWSKKTIMITTKNYVRDALIPPTKWFWTRQEMFRHQRFRRTTYTNTMTEGVKYVSGNRVAQVYVTDFGDVVIYPLAHR